MYLPIALVQPTPTLLPEGLNIAWLALISFSLSIGISIAGIAYMIGEFMNSPPLKAWVKAELYELWVSFLIIALSLAGIAFMNAFITSFTGGKDSFMLAQTFLAGMEGRLVHLYLGLMQYEALMGFLSTLTVSIPIPETHLSALILGYVPLASISLLVEAHTLLVDFIGVAYSLVLGQTIVLDFIKNNMIQIFLPLGILFRSFPLTRKMGSSIIALALVAYVAYPLTIVFNQEMLKYTRPLNFRTLEQMTTFCSEVESHDRPEKWLNEKLLTPVQKEQQEMFSIPEKERASFWHVLLGFGKTVLDMGVKFATFVASFWRFFTFWHLALFAKPQLYAYMLYESLIDDLNIVTQFLGLVILFPVINILICLSLYRSLAGALGGEEQIFGIAKIT